MDDNDGGDDVDEVELYIGDLIVSNPNGFCVKMSFARVDTGSTWIFANLTRPVFGM